jgi:hypothetical protein
MPEPTDPRREAMAREGLELVPWAARRVGKLPPGLDTEELESLGATVVYDAMMTFPAAQAKGCTWNQHVRTCLRSAFLKAIRDVRGSRRKSKHGRVAMHNADGDTIEIADRGAEDPGAVVAAREEVGREVARRQVTAAKLEKKLDSPKAVAEKAAGLHRAMLAGITTADVTGIVETLVTKAQDGDLRAAQMVLDLVARNAADAAGAADRAGERERAVDLQVLEVVDGEVRRGLLGATRAAIRLATGLTFEAVGRAVERLLAAGELIGVNWIDATSGVRLEGYRRPN